MGIFDDAREEDSLRLHIRHLLYDYAIQHLTINYIEFTEQAVTELLSQSLREVPLTESYAVRPPTDPFESLTRLYAFEKLEKCKEDPPSSPEALRYLKSFLAGIKFGKNAKSRSERAVHEDEYDVPFPQMPFEPILSRRARGQTPRPGTNEFRKFLPNSHHDLTKSSSTQLNLVKVEPIQDPVVKLEHVLNVAFHLTPGIGNDVKQFLKAVAALSRPGANYKNQYLDPMRPDSPPLVIGPSLTEPEPNFIPIFPRCLRPGSGKVARAEHGETRKTSAAAPVESMDQLATRIQPVEMEEDEPNLHRENMIVVNGWQTYCSSSPPRTSSTPTSSQEDQVDQLRIPSSPDTELSPVKALKDMRMDVPAITRAKRIRGATGKVKQLGAGKSLAAFLLNSLKSQSGPPTARSRKPEVYLPTALDAPPLSDPRSSSPQPSESMVGNPASVLGLGNDSTQLKSHEDGSDADMGTDLTGIYQALKGEDPKNIVLTEKVDERNLLMEVPNLPPPTEHPSNALFLPSKFSDIIAPVTNKKVMGNAVPLNLRSELYAASQYQFLKKTKGLQSLNVSLSWVPITVQDRPPTTVELLGVDSLIDRDDTKNGISVIQIQERVGTVLDAARMICDSECTSDGNGDGIRDDNAGADDNGTAERLWKTWVEDGEGFVEDDMQKCEIILSREERRRLAGLSSKRDVREEEEDVVGEWDGHAGEGGTGADVVGEWTAYAGKVGAGVDVEGHDGEANDDGSDTSLLRSNPGRHHIEPEPEPDLHGSASRLISPYDHDAEWLHGDDVGQFQFPRQPQLSDDEQVDIENDSDKENWEPSRIRMRTPQSGYPQEYVSEIEDEDGLRPYKRRRLNPDELELEDVLEPGCFVDDSGVGFLPDDFYSSHVGMELGHEEPSTDFVPGPGLDVGNYQRAQSLVQDIEISDGRHAVTQNPIFDPASLTQHSDFDFEPLCFDSQLTEQGHDINSTLHTFESNPVPIALPEPECATVSSRHSTQPTPKSNLLSRPLPRLNPEIFNSAFGAADFARLRARKVESPESAEHQTDANVSSTANTFIGPSIPASEQALPLNRTAPQDLYDQHTLRIPSTWALPTSEHRYLTSMGFLQKQALVRSLRSSTCAIGLVERDTLGGVDLIIDPHTAIIFTNLFALPSQCEALLLTLCAQSQRYTRLLVLFEAYAPSLSFKSRSEPMPVPSEPSLAGSRREGTLFAYTPPVLKAIKKLRRDLSIAEACDRKRESCRLAMAFANTVEEAAVLTRCFGDIAEAADADATAGALWGDRAWLEDEYIEDEQSLAAADGMNHFAACVVLCQTDLDSFLEFSVGERERVFGPQIGQERMSKLNELLGARTSNAGC